jgi:hypothetical protein
MALSSGMSKVPLFTLYANSGAGRGLFATRDIDQGETLIRIPEDCFIAYGVLDAIFPELPCKLEETDFSVKELTSHQVFVVFILLESEKGDKSQWKEYISSLPPLSSFEGMPLLWSAKGRKSLPPPAKRTAPHEKR